MDKIFRATALQGVSYLLQFIYFSFSAAPPEGTKLKVYDGDGSDESQVKFSLDITADGPGIPLNFGSGIEYSSGKALTVRLTNAGDESPTPGSLNVGCAPRVRC